MSGHVHGFVCREDDHGDDEVFCGQCFAGLMSSEHHTKCVVPERNRAEATA